LNVGSGLQPLFFSLGFLIWGVAPGWDDVGPLALPSVLFYLYTFDGEFQMAVAVSGMRGEKDSELVMQAVTSANGIIGSN
jgi:hypothetical protein